MPSGSGADLATGHQPRVRTSLDDIRQNLALYFKQNHNLPIEGKIMLQFTSKYFEKRVEPRTCSLAYTSLIEGKCEK